MESYQFNDAATPLTLLLSRRSGKARDLVAPGPDAAEMETMLKAATRVPDHGKLAPWRFIEITDRDAFAALLLDLYGKARGAPGKTETRALEDFARQAPRLLAAISLVNGESRIPEWEQLMTAGAATMTLLHAAHAMGYAANWLTEPAAYLPGLPDALGFPGGRIAGFIFIGTPSKPLEERPRPELAHVTGRWPR
ncbi:nitroreductase family protein [Sandaracinobacteroides sp. A072]|uniref:nitroreductase family protein n=1 Tax=Sandaracinobacteroides sp. A072 TaxID=3461146 RepID=UPI004041D465